MASLPPPQQTISYFPVAEANNSIRVLLTVMRRGTPLEIWYTSIERLTYQNQLAPWEHVTGTAQGHSDESDAVGHAASLLNGGWKHYVTTGSRGA